MSIREFPSAQTGVLKIELIDDLGRICGEDAVYDAACLCVCIESLLRSDMSARGRCEAG